MGDIWIKKLAMRSFSAEVEWNIKQFLDREPKKEINSPNFQLPGAEWFIKVYPSGDEQGWISAYLSKKHSTFNIQVKYTLGIKRSDSSELASWTESKWFKKEGDSGGWKRFFERSALLKCVEEALPNGTLKIFCQLCIYPGGIFSDVEFAFPEGRFLKKLEIDNLEREKKEIREELNSAKTEIQDVRGQFTVANSEKQDIIEKLLTAKEETETFQKDTRDLIRDLFSACQLQKSTCIDLEREKAELEKRLALLAEENQNLKNLVSQTKKEKKAAIDYSQEKSSVLINDDYSLSTDYMELFLSGVQTDITICVKDQEFLTHKAVLVARSSVFRAMFEANLIENRLSHINIDDCEPETFYWFLVFLYGGKLDIISSTNSLGLYKLADKYNIKKLKKGCFQHLRNDISVDSVCDILQLAILHDEFELLKIATEFSLNNSAKVLQTTKWMLFLRENPVVANELLINNATK